MEYVLAYITAGDMQEAEKISSALVENNLAACVNVFPSMVSMYKWQGRTEQSSEISLLAKTRADFQQKLMDKVLEVHSYECPCIVFLPVSGGNPDFLAWISEQTQT